MKFKIDSEQTRNTVKLAKSQNKGKIAYSQEWKWICICQFCVFERAERETAKLNKTQKCKTNMKSFSEESPPKSAINQQSAGG